MSPKLYAIFIWYNDDPITGTVLNVSSITEPRKEYIDYCVGDLVKARCGSYGINPAIIGKIGDESEKKAFEKLIVTPPAFNELVNGLPKIFELRKEQSVDDLQEQSADVEMPTKKNAGQAVQETCVVKPKAVKRKLIQSHTSMKCLQSEAEDRALAGLVDEEIQRTSTSLQDESIQSSKILGQALDIVNKTGTTPQKSVVHSACHEDFCSLQTSHNQLENRTAYLEYNLNYLWNEVEKLKSQATSCTNSPGPSGLNISHSYSSAFTAPSPKVSMQAQPSPVTSTPKTTEFGEVSQTGEMSTSTDSAVLETERTYNGFIKSQILEEIGLKKDFKKATAAIFRKIFTEEETKGRSLSGGTSKDGTRRPALEDTGKVIFLEGIIQEKWPHTPTESIRQVIRDLLKPSRAKALWR